MSNKRLLAMIEKAYASDLRCGQYLLDCYMGQTIRTEFSHTITTRTPTDNNTFVLEVYEQQDRRNTDEEDD